MQPGPYLKLYSPPSQGFSENPDPLEVMGAGFLGPPPIFPPFTGPKDLGFWVPPLDPSPAQGRRARNPEWVWVGLPPDPSWALKDGLSQPTWFSYP